MFNCILLVLLSVTVSCLAEEAERGSFCYAIEKRKLGTPYLQFYDSPPNKLEQRYLFELCEDNLPACILTWEPPNIDSQCCGIDTFTANYIMGGEEAEVNQYPWLVAIDYVNQDGGILSMCAGSLISGRYVLTAGHCVIGRILNENRPFQVRLGDHDLKHSGPDCSKNNANLCTDGEVTIPIEKITLHPNHFHNNYSNVHDIALIKLAETVKFTDYIRPICLPSFDINVDLDEESEVTVYAVGWGSKRQTEDKNNKLKPINEYSDVKRHVELPIRNIKECRDMIGKFINTGHICAGGYDGKDACRGDSGGPLSYMNEDGIQELVGVVSFGTTWCGEGVPGVYTNVYEHLDWISEQITY